MSLASPGVPAAPPSGSSLASSAAVPAPPVEVVAITRDDAEALLAVDQWAFFFDRDERTPDEEQVIVDGLEWDRSYGARIAVPGRPAEPPRLAGVYSVVSGAVSLPFGREVRASGLTWVGVHPRDRRRGVLRAMMRHHLDDVAARGEPFSILGAAEGTIYGRFGYGTATYAVRLTVPRGTSFRDVPGTAELLVDLELADEQRHAGPLADCFERARRQRPGGLARQRPEVWRELFLDPLPQRRGAESKRVLTVSTPDGELRGYALFQRRWQRAEHGPDAVVKVHELVGLDAAASQVLWSRLADLDLTGQVKAPLLALDDPLVHQLADPRAGAPRLTDNVWLRLVDVPSALAARGYGRDVDVVLEIVDELLPANAGRWRLTAGPDGATCERTDRPAQLSLDVRELGAAYLGGPTLAALAAAGLVGVHDEQALTRASVAFVSPVAPHCGWQF